MGVSGNIICCKKPDSLVKSIKLSINNNEETDDIDEINSMDKNINNNTNNNNNNSHYEGFSPEELEIINEKMNINYNKYKSIPLKSSDINIIYKSGIIRSNSSNI